MPEDADDIASAPNDAFVKESFSDPVHAVPLLRRHLPPRVAEHANWQSLQVVPGSFVRAELSQLHSDLLFSVEIGRRTTLLYVLFEHQSRVDPTMPLRLLGYTFEILTRHRKEHGLPLPPVLPLVFHQGPQTWSISTAFEDLFDLPTDLAEDLLPYLPKFSHALIDLTVLDPAVEEDDEQLRILLNLMKLVRRREIGHFFRWFAGVFVESLPDDFVRRLLYYAFQSDSGLDVSAIIREISANPKLENRVMSIAEQLRAEGRQEGRQEGRKQGLREGLVGQVRLLEEFLQCPPQDLEVLSLEQLEDLQRQLRREYETRTKRQ